MDLPSLHQLIRQEDWENVLALIEAGADIHVASGSGYTPLMQAVDVGSLELVDYLLARGVFINFAGREGNTALHVAVSVALEVHNSGFPQEQDNAFDMLRLLVARGANVKQKNDLGETAVDWARAAFSKRIVEVLERD